MAKQFKGVLFDLDGTLLDTADDLGAALNFVLKENGFEAVAPTVFRPIASDGAAGLLSLGFSVSLKNYDLESLRNTFLTYYETNIATHTRLYEGVASLIEFLDKHCIPWGIVTNKPIRLTNTLLPHFPEFELNKVTIGGDSLTTRKPHPAPLLHACQALNIAPEECLYVGDAPRDIEAGNAAGMHSIVALWGYIKDTKVCDAWQADAMCKSPVDIKTYFS